MKTLHNPGIEKSASSTPAPTATSDVSVSFYAGRMLMVIRIRLSQRLASFTLAALFEALPDDLRVGRVLLRDSEALLLRLPDVGERGKDVPSGKLFEYLAARRPILAAVPTDGAATNLIREAQAGIVTR